MSASLPHWTPSAGALLHTFRLAERSPNLGYPPLRRRAFVDFASAASARQAISSLNGANIRNYRIDVSFAIVQRSGGPLAAAPLPAPAGALSPSSDKANTTWSNFAFGATSNRPLELPSTGAFAPIPAMPIDPSQMRKLLVTNLSAGVIDDDDLANLFSPYGAILESHLDTHPTTGLPAGSGYVVFNSADEAALAHHDMNKKPLSGGNEALVTQLTLVTNNNLGQLDSSPPATQQHANNGHYHYAFHPSYSTILENGTNALSKGLAFVHHGRDLSTSTASSTPHVSTPSGLGYGVRGNYPEHDFRAKPDGCVSYRAPAGSLPTSTKSTRPNARSTYPFLPLCIASLPHFRFLCASLLIRFVV
jgi:hypothetical protein